MAIDYKTLVNNINNIYTDGSSAIEYINSQQLTMEEFGQLIDASDRFNVVKNAEGTILNVSEKVTSQVASEGIETALNSNLSTVTSTTANIPIKVGTTQAGKVTLTQGLSTGAKFIGNTVLPAIAATSAGIMLGKAIDSTLYSLNPDFWDANGMSSLNPETWSNITAGQDGISANLFNMVFGINPTTGKTQSYIEQDAFAYLVAYMIERGVFNPPEQKSDWTNISNQLLTRAEYYGRIPNPITLINSFSWQSNSDNKVYEIRSTDNWKMLILWNTTRTVYQPLLVSKTYDPPAVRYIDGVPDQLVGRTINTYNGQTFYGTSIGYFNTSSNTVLTNVGDLITSGSITNPNALDMWNFGKIIFDGTITGGGGIAGITDQDGATGFDASSITDPTNIAAVLSALQAQYPDLFQNAITQPVGDPLQNPDRIYIPVGTPQLNPQDQTQPIGDIATQLQPELDPDTFPELDLDPWVDMVLKPEYEPEPEPDPDPEPNPPDTGEGVTPPVVPPDGTAGALFTVYNPTQSEIDSFGGWLWSSNFVDQLLKVFNDPMQAIISLHKIFATPSTGSSSNIYVGYLNSGVSAAKVTNQYTIVNCGSVNLSEYYGNALDYTNTNVDIYLPFIGIVNLDINDIMRSTITVKYSIDVYTGACLADVEVTRDTAGGVLYQYAGNCAVHYPLSSGSYMDIISGLLGIAGTVASGGSFAPMLIGAGATALTAHNNISRSGGFSANAGAMGIKKPYLIISRSQTTIANNYKKFAGGENNKYVTINNLSGFIRAKYVKLSGITDASNEELSLIKNELLNGIFYK